MKNDYKEKSNTKYNLWGFACYILRVISPFVLIGIIYYIWLLTTRIFIPCPIRRITGYKCPGCGITHILLNIMNLNFKAAFWANPFLFITLPFLAIQVTYSLWLTYNKRTMPKWNQLLLITYCITLIIWGITRNLLFL